MLEIALLSAVTSFTICQILTDAGMILEFWPVFVDRTFKSKKLSKVLYDCPICQSFWMSILVMAILTPDFYLDPKNIFTPILSMFFAFWLNLIHNKV